MEYLPSERALLNRNDLVLLGFIAEKPSSGYDILTAIRRRGLDRWARIGTSSVYSRLPRLESAGCIEGRAGRDGNRPERTLYSITERGLTVLRCEILRHLTGFVDDPRHLGYSFLFAADHGETARHLRRHIEELELQLKTIEDMIAAEPRPTLHPEGPFLNCLSRDRLSVEIHYARAAVEILEDPARASRLDGWFYINFGSRDFQTSASGSPLQAMGN